MKIFKYVNVYQLIPILVVSFLLKITIISAQSHVPSQQWSYSFQKINNARSFQTPFTINNQIFTVWTERHGSKMEIKIAQFDTNLNWLKEATLSSSLTNESFLRVEQLGNKAYLFVSKNSLVDSKTHYFAYQINTENLTLSEVQTPFLSNKFHIYKISNSPEIVKTKDGFLFYELTVSTSDKNTYELLVNAFDEELSNKWNSSIAITSAEELNVVDAISSKENGLVILFRELTKEPSYRLMLVNESQEKPLSILVNQPKETPFLSLKLSLLTNGNIALAGIYDHNELNNNRKGTFYCSFSPADLSPIYNSSNPIPAALLIQNESEIISKKTIKKAENKQPLGIDTYYTVTNLIPTQDGGVVLIAEHQNIDGNTSDYCTRKNIEGKEFSFQDILVVGMDTNGYVIWEKKLAKSQKTKGNKWLVSFSVIQSGSDFFFVFNDNRKNHFTDNDRTQNMTRNKKDFALSVNKINESGYLSKDVLASYSNYEGFLVSSFSHQISSHSLLAVVKAQSGEEKLVLIKF